MGVNGKQPMRRTIDDAHLKVMGIGAAVDDEIVLQL